MFLGGSRREERGEREERGKESFRRRGFEDHVFLTFRMVKGRAFSFDFLSPAPLGDLGR